MLTLKGIINGERTLPYLLLAPLLILLLTVILFPFLWNFYVSLFDLKTTNLLTGAPFAGLSNYIKLFHDPTFFHSLGVSVYFVIGSLLGQFGLGAILALILHYHPGPARFFRVVFIIPWILSALIIGYSWIWMYNYQAGMINSILHAVGLRPIHWLNNMKMALWALVIANIWRGTPFTMLFVEAGLKTIPSEPYEAARVDGATSWQSFWYITVPLLRPTLTINLILTTMWTFNLFDTILVMTRGGPANATLTTAMYMYKSAFEYGLLSYGAAIAIVMLVINALLAVLYFYTVGRQK